MLATGEVVNGTSTCDRRQETGDGDSISPWLTTDEKVAFNFNLFKSRQVFFLSEIFLCYCRRLPTRVRTLLSLECLKMHLHF